MGFLMTYLDLSNAVATDHLKWRSGRCAYHFVPKGRICTPIPTQIAVLATVVDKHDPSGSIDIRHLYSPWSGCKNELPTGLTRIALVDPCLLKSST